MWDITPPLIKFRALEYKIIRTNSVISLNFTGNNLYPDICPRRLDLSVIPEYQHMRTVFRMLIPKWKVILQMEIVCFIQKHNATCITALFMQNITDIID